MSLIVSSPSFNFWVSFNDALVGVVLVRLDVDGEHRADHVLDGAAVCRPHLGGDLHQLPTLQGVGLLIISNHLTNNYQSKLCLEISLIT